MGTAGEARWLGGSALRRAGGQAGCPSGCLRARSRQRRPRAPRARGRTVSVLAGAGSARAVTKTWASFSWLTGAGGPGTMWYSCWGGGAGWEARVGQRAARTAALVL